MPFKVEDIDDFYYFQNRFEQLSRSKFVIVFEDAEDTVMHSEVDAAIRINMHYDGVLLRIKITKDQWESATGNPYKKYLNLLHIRELPYACVYAHEQVVARYHGQKARDSFAKILKFCAESGSKPPVVKSGVGQTIQGKSGAAIKGSESNMAMGLSRESGSISVQKSAAARSRQSAQGLDKGKGPSSQQPSEKSKVPAEKSKVPSTRSEKSKPSSAAKSSKSAKSKGQPESSKISKPSAQSSIPKKSSINPPSRPSSKGASTSQKNSQKSSKASSNKPSASSSNASKKPSISSSSTSKKPSITSSSVSSKK